jgi:hypothetical protein
MKLTGPACTEATNEAEEAKRRERAGDSAGGVRVEREVRHAMKLEPTRVARAFGFGTRERAADRTWADIQADEPKGKEPGGLRQRWSELENGEASMPREAEGFTTNPAGERRWTTTAQARHSLETGTEQAPRFTPNEARRPKPRTD